MADHRRDYDDGQPRHERDWSGRTGKDTRSWFGEDTSRQRRGNDERDDRFPYGGERNGDNDEWRSHSYPDSHREDRGSRWEGVHGNAHTPRSGEPGARSEREGGYYAAQTFGSYRTDDRPYHDRYRNDRQYDGPRERDEARYGAWNRPRYSSSHDAASEYFRAARDQRDEFLRYEAQSPGAEGDDRDAAWPRRERGGYWRQYEGRSPFAGRGPKDYRRSDDRVREEICDCMTDDPLLDASEITVQVSEGVVTLSGSVTSREQKRRAEDVAERISGVKDVANQLRVAREASGHSHPAAPPVTQSETGTPSKSSRSTT